MTTGAGTTGAGTRVRADGVLPRFARWPVLGVAVVIGALLTAVSSRYGYFGDELYFVAAGRHLDWGYADQPPLLPLLALVADTVAPGSVAVLRVPATVATVLGVVLTALLAREFGGGTRAQVPAAAAFAASPTLIATGHLLATSTVDPLFWVLVSWSVVRWVRTRDDRMLLVAGVATAVGLQAKLLLGAFWAVLVVAVLVIGPRDLLRRPLLWVGGAIAALSLVPTVLWQAANGWPQLEMGRVVAGESVYAGGALLFLPLGILGAGAIAGTALAVVGVVRLLRAPHLREYRFLVLTALGVTVLFLATGGRPYYVAGLFPVLWAVGAAELEDIGFSRRNSWWRWVPTVPTFAVTLVLLVIGNVLPVAPIESHAGKPLVIGNFQLDEFGWPELVDDAAAAYHALPAEQAEHTALIGGSYWSAAALDHFGPERGLPPAHSSHRGYAWFGIPDDDATSALLVGDDPRALAASFTTVEQVGVVDNDADINNLHQGAPIWLLTGRTREWPVIWEQVRRM